MPVVGLAGRPCDSALSVCRRLARGRRGCEVRHHRHQRLLAAGHDCRRRVAPSALVEAPPTKGGDDRP